MDDKFNLLYNSGSESILNYNKEHTMNNISKTAVPPVPPFKPKHLVYHPKRGAISRFFRNIGLFFTRIGLLCEHKIWFSEAKVKQMISETKNPETRKDASVYTPQIEKVIAVLTRLSRFKDLDQEESQIASLVDEKLPGFQLLDKMSQAETKLLFQIQADEFGANDELEGYTLDKTLTYLDDFFKIREKEKLDLYGLPKSVCDEISTAAKIANAPNLETFIHYTQEAIQKISENPVLLPGGWRGAPSGHAMYYEVIPQGKEKVTFRIFNLGAGATGALDPADYKTKAAPYVDFEGIALDKMMDKHIIQALYELNTYAFFPGTTSKTQYGAEDIYKSLKTLLAPESISQPKDMLKTTQRSGVCTWRSLMAFISSRMSKAEYKRFVCDIKMQSMLHRNWNVITEKKEIHLLQKSHETVARALDKLTKEKFVGFRYLAQANELLATVEPLLKKHKVHAYQSAAKSSSWLEFKSYSMIFTHAHTKPLHAQVNEVHQDKILTPNTSLIESIQSYSLPKAIDEVRQTLAKKNFHSAHIALEKYIESLDFKAFDPDHLEDISVQLGQLSKLYFDTCFLIPEADRVLAERVITLEKVLNLQSEIAKSLCPESEHFILYEKKQSIFFNPNDKKKEYQAMKKRWPTKITPSNYSFQLPKENFEILFRKSPDLQRLFPEHEKLFTDDPDYYKLPLAGQMAKLYASDRTPVWFQMLRNTALLTHYLAKKPVANPTNSTTSFNLSLKDELQPGSSKEYRVVVSVKEISEDIIKKCPRKKDFEFASNYPPCSSPTMEKFIQYVVKKSSIFYYLDEKRLLAIEPNQKFETHYQDLAHVFTLNNKIIEGFEYFYRHPEKLTDPEYQTLFETFLFNGGHLKDELASNKGLPELLNVFLKNQVNHCLATNEIQKATFLIRMSRLLHTYDHTIECQTDSLKVLLNQEDLDFSLKSVIYAELVAAYGKKENINQNEIAELIVWSAFLQEHPVAKKWMSPKQNNEVREAIILRNKQIVKTLVEDKSGKILNRTAKEVYHIDAQDSWEAVHSGESISFQTRDKQINYNPTCGKLLAANRFMPLPLEIAEHLHFTQNFKGVFSAIHKAHNVYSFDYKGKSFLVKLDDSQLLIEQKIDDKWYRYVPEETFVIENHARNKETHLSSRHLLQNYSQWQNLENPTEIVLIEHKTGKACYQVTLKNNQVKKISKTDSSLVLNRPSGLLTRFEHPTYIEEWSNNSKIRVVQFIQECTQTSNVELIELPRFGLSFTRDVKNTNHWKCDQFLKEGFFVAQEQSLPIMGAYTHYLVLENAAGKKKVLLPEYQIESPAEKKNTLLPAFEVNQGLDRTNREPQKYSTFDVNKNGMLESKSAASLHHLGLVLATAQEYKSAAHYLLKHGSKLTRYVKKEKKALKTLAKMGDITGDQSGNGLALQAYAVYLLARNALEHDIGAKSVYSEKHVEVYQNYLAHLNSATALKLTREEELFLLKFFLNNKYDPVLHVRAQKLDPEFARSIKIEQEPEFKPSNKNLTLNLKIPYNSPTNAPSFDSILLTRINFDLASNPVEMFKLIQNATPEQKVWLKEAFKFGKKTIGADWSFVFEDIFNHPGLYKFPKLDKYSSLSYSDWWSEVIDIAGPRTLEERQKVAKEIDALEKPKIPLKNAIAAPSPVKAFKVELKKLAEVPSFSAMSKPHFTVKNSKPNSKSYKKWLDRELAHPISAEPLYLNELKRLNADLTFQKDNVEYRIKNLKPLNKIVKELNRKKNQVRLKTLETDLITLANCPAGSYFDQLIEMMQVKGKLRRALTLDDLIISFAKNDPAALIEMNPHLAPRIDELYKKIQIYLIVSTREQQRTRALETLSKLETATGADKLDYEQQLGADLLAVRAFNPHENPTYLAFEYYANVLMREQQVDKLKGFLEGGDNSLVMEMIMGSGKSKVLLPLLGLLRADGKKLSMVIVPQPLFESVSSDTQRVLSEAFSQSLKSLHFHRNTQFDQYTLKRIKDDLVEIKDKKECLIITSKSIQCFLLKFVEESSKQKGVMTDELLLMRDILSMLAESSPLIDEVDTVLNVLHEVSFSTGAEVKPRDTEIRLIGKIYSLLYSDSAINEQVHIESNPNAGKANAELSEKNYTKKVKPILAKKLVDSFDAKERDLAKNYLLREDVSKEDQAKAQEYFKKLSHKKQNYLALAAEQLNNFLAHTLTKTCEEKYGLDLKGANNIAIPYAAANVPNVGSQFSNPYITMNYTFQYYVKKGISREILIKEIERLQSRAMLEMKENGASCTLQMTEGWKLFKEITGDLEIPLFNFNEAQINLLLEKINSRLDQKISFIQKIILPQLVLSEKKLSCNPQNLISFFLSANGFTGTLWNQSSMHSKIKALPDPGIDSKTLNILWNNSNEKIEVINGTTPVEMMNELATKGVRYDLISDSGGYFKEGGNTQIALQLSQKMGKPVVFYNKDNQQAIIENGVEVLLGESVTPVDQRCTFLDQSHTTGSDVAYKHDAVGLVTISRNMLLRDLLQSVWRLRGLDKSQKVKFILSKEVQGIICQTLGKENEAEISLGDILRFTIVNQTKQQGIDNFKGFRQEMYSHIQQLLFKVMLDLSYSEEQRKDTVAELEKFWIKNSNLEPRELFGAPVTEQETTLVIPNEIKKFKEAIKKLQARLPHLKEEFAPMQKAAEEHAKSLKDLMPSKMITPIRDLDHDQTTEVLDETEQETQTELEVNDQVHDEKIKLGFKTGRCREIKELNDEVLKDGSNYSFGIETYFDLDADLKQYSKAFSGLALTLNMLQWDKKRPSVADLKFFGSKRTPIHQIDFMKSEFTLDSKALLLSNYDERRHGEYNLGFGFCDQKRKLTDQEQDLVVKIKFLNGDSSYSKAEKVILERWLEENDAVKMYKLLQNHILAGFPEKVTEYNSNSVLKKVFTSLQVC